MLLVCHFTHKTWKRVDLFPILTTNDSSIFLSNSVNHGQGLMCLKFKPLFLYKQHPIGGHGLATSGTVSHSCFAWAADNMAWWTTRYRKLSRNVETHWTLQLGHYPGHLVFQHHLDVTSLVMELASVLDLIDESSSETVGHVCRHGPTAGGAVRHPFLTRATDDMSGGTAGNWQLSRNIEAHRAL